MLIKYNPQLDGLRCVAVSLVLVSHLVPNPSDPVKTLGYSGVELFFVISGFLITSLLLAAKGSFGFAYGRFLGRRTLRIFPIYYLTILALYLVNCEALKASLGYLLTYTYNYALVFKDAPRENVSHFWSLAVEEQFYLLWPLLVLALRDRLTLLKRVTVGILFVFCLQLLFEFVPGSWRLNSFFTFPRAYALLVGSIGAILYREKLIPDSLLNNPWVERMAFLCFAACLASNIVTSRLTFPLVCLFVVLKTFTTGFSTASLDSVLRHKTVIYLGSISYGIYIFHFPIIGYLRSLLPYLQTTFPFDSMGVFGKIQYNWWLMDWVIIPVVLVLTLAVSALSFHCFEKPLLTLKDRWFGNQKEARKTHQPVMA